MANIHRVDVAAAPERVEEPTERVERPSDVEWHPALLEPRREREAESERAIPRDVVETLEMQELKVLRPLVRGGKPNRQLLAAIQEQLEERHPVV